jgi:uncharacterized protein YcfJ
MNRSHSVKFALGAIALAAAAQAGAQITFYENEGFRGRTYSTDRSIDDLRSSRMSDRASSVIVESGRWVVCDERRFEGRCALLRRGSYDSLQRMGLNDRISSVRSVRGRGPEGQYQRPEPLAAPNYEYRQRPNETLYQATVTSAHAVMGSPEQRCWIERERLGERRSEPNVGGAILGAVIGGVLGHQVGGGTGRDLATAGGAVAGAAIGANTGRNSGAPVERDVQRCESTPNQTPAYWDVTYDYRGTPHRVQMSTDPGRTIAVNRNGEPRG